MTKNTKPDDTIDRLTKREWMATFAMEGLLLTEAATSPPVVAAKAVLIADALIDALNVPVTT